MADIAAIRITDISSFTVGADKYLGIKSMDIRVATPNVVAVREGSDAYASQMEKTSTDEFPVTASIVTEDMAQVLTLIAGAKADVVAVGKVYGGTTKTFTITNGLFRQASQQMNTQPGQLASTSVECVAVSADGSTIPLTIT